jgi:hypothetical protein
LSEVFGRTNEALPDVWLRLVAPSLPTDGWIGDLVSAAVATGAPLDVTAAPVLWGPALRREGLFLVAFGTHEPEHATDSDHACDLVSAHLVQVLSALGRPSLDLYFLTVRRAWEEHQTDGALRALESARADGLVTSGSRSPDLRSRRSASGSSATPSRPSTPRTPRLSASSARWRSRGASGS